MMKKNLTHTEWALPFFRSLPGALKASLLKFHKVETVNLSTPATQPDSIGRINKDTQKKHSLKQNGLQ